MCIAIVCESKAILTPTALKRGWDANPHGAGFAYVDDDHVVIKKGYMDYPSLEKDYLNYAQKFADESPFLVHMRVHTSGGITAKNTHPFAIKGGALIHNGIMFSPTGTRAGPTHDRRSDTRVFAEDLYNILQLDEVKKAAKGIHEAIGRGNKVAFLYDNKEIFILGESQGFWKEGIWYSNSGCGIYPERYGQPASK